MLTQSEGEILEFVPLKKNLKIICGDSEIFIFALTKQSDTGQWSKRIHIAIYTTVSAKVFTNAGSSDSVFLLSVFLYHHFFITKKPLSMKGIVFDIKRFAIHDGPGIRTTVFLKGCPLRCWWCHNPESQDVKTETDVKKILLDGVPFEKSEQIGRLMSVEELTAILEKESVFYDESGGGVTFSGGEPLLQHTFLTQMLKTLKHHGIHTAVDTSGHVKREILQTVMPHTDLFLYDLKHMDAEKHRRYTGVDNKLILNNLKYLAGHDKDIFIRIPVIPRINDSEKDILDMISYLRSLNGSIREVHLLPYHAFAGNKYVRLKKENKLKELKSYDRKDLHPIREKFRSAGFSVKIGG